MGGDPITEDIDLGAPTERLLEALAHGTSGGIARIVQEIQARPDLLDAVRTAMRSGAAEDKAAALLALRGLQGPAVAAVARQGLGDASPWVRSLAVTVLAELGDEGAVDVARALDDPDPEVVVRAAAALPEAASVPAVRRLVVSPDEGQRRAGVELVGRNGMRELQPDVVMALRDPSPRVRTAALAALGRLGPLGPGDLWDLLADDDAAVREAGLRALVDSVDALPGRPDGWADMSSVVPLLADPSVEVRVLAVRALARAGEPRCDDLAPLLHDPERVVREAAMAGLAALECRGAAGRLRDLAVEASDERERAHAAHALADLDPALLDPVRGRLLRDSAPLVRAIAAAAASTAQADAATRATLAELVRGDESAMVRSAATRSLGVVDPAAVEVLARARQDDPDPGVRLTVVRTLAKIAGAVQAVVDALGDRDPQVRLAAVESLDPDGSPEVAVALARLAEDEQDEQVRAALLAARARVDPDAAETLRAMAPARPLFDPDGEGSAYTTWLQDLTWYPVSPGVTFFNTGRLRVWGDDEAGEHEHAYRVIAGDLVIDDDHGTTALRTPYVVEADQPEPGSPRRFRLTLAVSGPPLDPEGAGEAHYYVEHLAP